MISLLGGEFVQIVIHALEEGTFFAKIVVRQGDDLIEIDYRPSDAIAVGAAIDIPIFVEESVLDEASSEPISGIQPPEHPGWMPDFGEEERDDESEQEFG